MDFIRLTLENKTLIESWFSRNDSYMSANDFATVYSWDINEQTVYEIFEDVLTIRNTRDGIHYYYCPVALDDRPLIPYVERIAAYENTKTFFITSIPSRYSEQLRELPFGVLTDDRDNYDYLYLTSDLVGLAGKKYHSKRNFLHRFKVAYAYEFRDYSESDYDACMALFDEWKLASESDDMNERTALSRMLSALPALGARCGLLFVEGRLIALGVTSVSTRGVGQVHFEKAVGGFDGAYAAINNLCAERYLNETVFVNRQEDMGIEGLRKAKLSYHPAEILVKYKFGTKE